MSKLMRVRRFQNSSGCYICCEYLELRDTENRWEWKGFEKGNKTSSKGRCFSDTIICRLDTHCKIL